MLTEGGPAIAALLPIDDADLESIALSLSPKFQAVIEQSDVNIGTVPACRLTVSASLASSEAACIFRVLRVLLFKNELSN